MSEPLTTAPPLLPSGRAVPAEPMTYEQFLEWIDEDANVEWVAGLVVPMSPVNGPHDELVGFLRALLELFREAHRAGKLRGELFQMKTGPDLPGRAPDLLFVANENLARLHHTFLEGPADIVVEVISPDSVYRDREEKYREYEQGGVREYWLLDPQHRQADFLQFGEDGRYRPIPLEEGDVFRSRALPGWWLKVEWLWEPRPKLLDVLREWQLI
jgi:Uma2 family endonuclease